MTDKLSREARSHLMKSIKSISKLEEMVCKELWSRGLRFRRNVKGMVGNPDIAIKKYKVVIFIDSCFWHFCPTHGHMPKTNVSYWMQKLDRNIERDIEITEYYRGKGWHILRIWEHQFHDDFNFAVGVIQRFIENSKIENPTANPLKTFG